MTESPRRAAASPADLADIVERAFQRIPSGRVHYRFMDAPPDATSPPLYMAHGGPGCSRGLEPMIALLGKGRRVIAPDMLGNGDSGPPRADRTDIAFYAECVVQMLDQLGIDQVDFYGDHTGAQIGAEFAVRHPRRLRRLVLDGAPLFPAALKAELLDRYAPPIEPDEYGGYLARVWGFVRELTVHFPHYRTDPAHRLTSSAIPPVEARHGLAVDILKSLSSYHMAYRAAFSHDTEACLRAIAAPTLFIATEGDPLAEYVDAAATLVPGAARVTLPRADKAPAIAAFLDRDEPA